MNENRYVLWQRRVSFVRKPLTVDWELRDSTDASGDRVGGRWVAAAAAAAAASCCCTTQPRFFLFVCEFVFRILIERAVPFSIVSLVVVIYNRLMQGHRKIKETRQKTQMRKTFTDCTVQQKNLTIFLLSSNRVDINGQTSTN